MEPADLKSKLKAMMVEELMLKIAPDAIGDDQPLFGPESVGLDSVDALQLVVMLDKHFGVKVPDPAAAKLILQNVNSMVQAIQSKPAG